MTGTLVTPPRVAIALDVSTPPVEHPTVAPLDPPEKWSYRKTLLIVRQILAHRGIIPALVRVWHDGGTNVRIGMQKGDRKTVLGGGATFADAINNVFVAPYIAREEELARVKAEEQPATSPGPTEEPPTL